MNIADTGTGMDEKTINRIFEPFFTTKTKDKGTGLGLSAAYGTIFNHEGAISVESTPGVGSTFSIYLPVNTEAEAMKTETSKLKIVRGTGNIMIVDDEEVILGMLSNMLEDSGYNPLACIGGEQAIELFKKNWEEIDLVILDLIMPNMTGEETFIELKKINPNVRVLISSGYSKSKTIDKLMKMGAIGSMPKPYELKTFLNAIRSTLDTVPES